MSLKDHIDIDEKHELEDRFLDRKDNGLHYDDTMQSSHEPLSFTMDTYFDETTQNHSEDDDDVVENIPVPTHVKSSKTGLVPDSSGLVSKMWDDFSIHDYSSNRAASGNRRPRSSSTPRKKQAWSPVITIPKPFNMTVRDEHKKEKSHTRYSNSCSPLSTINIYIRFKFLHLFL